MLQPFNHSCILIALLGLFGGCAAGLDDAVTTHAAPLTQADVMAQDPEAAELLSLTGAKLIQVLDQSERAQQPTAQEFAAMGQVPDSRKADVQSTGSRVAMVTPKGAYLVELSEADLDAQFGDMFGTDGTAPDGNSNGRGWSDGVDNRTLLGTAVHRHGQVWGAPGACSGALIGSRIVRTAAHCLVTHSLTSGGVVPTANGQSFNYRQNGGSSQVNATSQTAFFGGGYISNNCGLRTAADYWSGYRANFDTCTWQDWAYIILPSNWNNGSYYEWYGYRGLGSGDLGLRLRHVGYPGCGAANSPTGCANNSQYRDQSTNCTVGEWVSGQSKWNSDCDMNSGHSGGGLWQYSDSTYLIGHYQWEFCTTCPDPDGGGPMQAPANPNRALGHDTWLFDYQNTLRSTYP